MNQIVRVNGGRRRAGDSRLGKLLPWIGAGAALAGAAVFNRRAAGKAERDYPPLGHFLEVDGVRLHYVERGKGSPVVLIHGNASLLQDFTVSGLVDKLARHHRVILFDRPGYGHSSRPRGTIWTPERQAALFVKACDALGADRPIVVGHSWGTLPALAWALDHRQRVAALVLISGYYYGTPRPDALFAAVGGAPILGDLISNTTMPLQIRLMGPLGNRQIFSPTKPTANYKENMPFALMIRPSQLRATAADSAQMPIAAARLQRRYGELGLPITIIWGDGDKLVGQAGQSARLARELVGSTAVTMRGLGHMAHHVDPGKVAHAIEAAGIAG